MNMFRKSTLLSELTMCTRGGASEAVRSQARAWERVFSWWLLLIGCTLRLDTGTLYSQQTTESKATETPSKSTKDNSKEVWTPLLKGSDLTGWKKTNFGGEGDVELKDGELTLGFGDPLTGVTYDKKDFPKSEYEMRWEAKRVEGQDFFAGVTFPIGDEFCSFIAGGWGGGLIGISSINGDDASENETTGFEDFKNGEWYRFRVRVDSESLQAWVNDREVVSVDREDHKFSIRIEVGASRPLGYCNFQCVATVRGWEYRNLKEEKPKAKALDEKATSSIDSSDAPVFMQIKKDKNDDFVSMQTSVSKYRISSGAYAGAEIDLIGAVHVGERSYYRELNQRFKSYDALLFELVADPNVRLSDRKKDRGVYNPLSAMQVGMKDALNLTFQLDEVDYAAKNFVHADMTPDEFMEDMKKRKDGFLTMFARVLGSSIAAQGSPEVAGADGRMIAALMSKNRPIALRQVMAEQFDSMEIQLSGLEDGQGKSTLLTERNRKVMEVLEKQLKLGKRKLGIFYGAAHLKDMDRRLVDDFKAVRGDVEWLDAWLLSDDR
ncbi:MAG: family 16 glycoside hydrolase [Pirellulaceae bacterium]|nr:family 16 glycoside hydrolase [Pirellulaceae bacterium]